ncbi:hypothetical protein MMC12_002221 [Toensbergia leucococca]|nr:hypothetical protein [Toensbergia leucococca]
METSEDKQWASKYLLDPLTAPEPSQETGPGTHYNSTFGNMKDRSTSGVTNQKSGPSAHVRQLSKSNRNGYPSPPASVSPRQDQFSHRREAFPPAYDGANSQRRSLDQASSDMITSTNGRRRVSSLTSRFPGDQSHRPLDIIKRDAKLANRAPHLRKNHTVGPDTIDSLDNVVGAYHHEGPFDATLLARNTSLLNSPVEAVSGTNEEALKATPREKIIDSLERHRPLDGVAVVPPGMTDQAGRTYNYREGANMMIEDGGNYKRWPGVKYLPEDIKGKGEPSYSLEKALHDDKGHRRIVSDGNSAIEMTSRPRSSDDGVQPSSNQQSYGEWENEVVRSKTTGSKGTGLLRKRIGSLRKSKNASGVA